MSVSSTFLALLIALITVSTSLIPVLSEWVTDDPKIAFTQPIVVDGKLSLLATNLGQRPAVIADIRTQIPGTIWADAPFLADNKQYIVPNGTHNILVDIPFMANGNSDWVRIYKEFIGGNDIAHGERMADETNPNVLTFTIKQFDNTEYDVPVYLDFPELNPLAGAHRDKCSGRAFPKVFGSQDPPSIDELAITEQEVEAARLGCVSSAFYEKRNVTGSAPG